MDSLDVATLSHIIALSSPDAYRLSVMSTLCRAMKEVCYSPALWKNIVLKCRKDSNLYGWGFEMMAARMAQSESLDFSALHVPDRPNPWIHFGLEKVLENCGPHTLKRLRLDYVCQLPFADLLLTKIAALCPLLEEFTLTATNFFVSDSAVANLVGACPNLTHFGCFVKESHPLHALSDTILWRISKKLPDVEALEINANNVTENGLFALEDCRRLTRLALHVYRRGIFERARLQENFKPTCFQKLDELSFIHVLPSVGELRCIIRMCPQLQKMQFRPSEGDSAMFSHGQTLKSTLEKEAPQVECEVAPFLSDTVEELTSAQLAQKKLAKERNRRVEEVDLNCLG